MSPVICKPTWETDHPHPRAEGFKVRFFITKWENPRPNEVITSIDFVSGDNYAFSPVLIGITGVERIH
ncbi:MAG: hypothetical protein N3D17_06925 [bacterium]|nr:hypothetical protein [bacterium]